MKGDFSTSFHSSLKFTTEDLPHIITYAYRTRARSIKMSEQKRSGLSSFMEKFSSRSSKKAADNKFTYLSEFHTIFIIDDSTSMGGDKWSQVRKVLEEIAPVCTKYDKDGIELHFLNDDEIFTNITR